MKSIYFACVEDKYGQRTGDYVELHLNDEEIEFDRFGNKTYKGIFLFENRLDVVRACLD
jgi:hypothetical protein